MNYPVVTIVMAIYNPQLQWLKEQLLSLNTQDYPNLQLIVWNDNPHDMTCKLFLEKYITKFSYKLYTGKVNIGSTLVFENMTKLVTSKYIAYCDQDDIWLSNKISTLVQALESSNAYLVCSDMYVIDKNSRCIAESIKKIRPRQLFYEKHDQFNYLLSKNFVTGCTILANTEFAKAALPFHAEYLHDWWLAIYASYNGKLQIIHKPLIKYRIHANNQTSVFGEINNKHEYYKNRLFRDEARIDILKKVFNNNRIKNFITFVELRKKYFIKHNFYNAIKLFSVINSNKEIVLFELILPFIPSQYFKLIVKYIKNH